MNELISAGKSGSFFYYTSDGKFLIKTMTRSDFRFLKKILKNYYNYISKNPNTYLVK